ncbi:MAG TPA: hypothetical protein PLE61_08725 [Vicinamibacterales bacterium]|nr:hypothetical protein [Vicinamibacterales bacterium]HPW20886.1 hypothetical protein [Vicinamibacterales bacterium]
MHRRHAHDENGVALVVVLLTLMLVAAIMAGVTAAVISEQRLEQVDQDRTESFYAASGALEKLSADLGNLFTTTYAPTVAQVTALNASPPSSAQLPGVTYVTTSEGPGYGITSPPDANGDGFPDAVQRSITSGTFQGFTGLVTGYTAAVTARTGNVGEVRLQRQIQTVAIPLFQFGQFSEFDLGFHPAYDFDFGGRIHTNGNLYLAAGTTLTIGDKITVLGEVVRKYAMNGQPTSSSWPGTVRIIKAPGSYRALAFNEGSVVESVGSALNEPTWSNLSIGTYHGYIVNGRTGARRLDLPVVAAGANPIELIRRPAPGETTSSPVFPQRYFAMASLRILLSDTAADITSLPTVTGTAPIQLGTVEPAGYTVAAATPEFAQAPSVISKTNYRTNANAPLLGGYIKIEKMTSENPPTWVDVTLDILKLGIASKNLSKSGCLDPSPNAVIRIQRVKDQTACNASSTAGSNFWPKVLYDTREGLRRENESTSSTNVYLGGVMHYIELDVGNLSRWFMGLIGSSGPGAVHTTGYTVYFSDRRGNRNSSNVETGEYGAEDFVNPESSSGAANGRLDAGEDVNDNKVLDVYGQTPRGPSEVTSWSSPLDSTARPWTAVTPGVAQVNPPRFFRRALKLVNGTEGKISLGSSGGVRLGLTVASENPVYVEGNYNATSSGFGASHVACSVAADAVTMLSSNWNDNSSFSTPNKASSRPATTTRYRLAVLTGKGRPFPRPSAGSPPVNFGTDGGTHNFLRMLEDWSGATFYYRGSMASLYYNRQALGTFKDGDNTYSPPTRDFLFDTEFLTPALLPPRTPMFRDVNSLGFTQVLTPPQ